MSCLGVHFALSDDDVAALLALGSDEERLEYLQESLEPKYFAEPKEDIAESDKAWDAMHRALSDGSLDDEGGEYPLSHTVLGGTLVYGDSDYIMSLKSPKQVKDVAAVLAKMTEGNFRELYNKIDEEDYDAELSDEDFEYTWGWFEGVRSLFNRAADMNRHILFTADQ